MNYLQVNRESSLIRQISLTSLPEMRQLDGERQSLVYNHHHELIDASDTLSAVSRSSASLTN